MLGTLGTLMAARNGQLNSVKLFESLGMKSCRMDNRKLEKRTGSLFCAEMEIYISAICLTMSESRLLTVRYRSVVNLERLSFDGFVSSILDKLKV